MRLGRGGVGDVGGDKADARENDARGNKPARHGQHRVRKWVTVFGDDKMAAAVVDRLVYTGRLVEFNGASCRIESRVLCC